MYLTNNNATIIGKVIEELTFSHELFGQKFYTTKVAIKRLSQVEDIIPIMLRESFYQKDIADTYIEVSGQLRSYNCIGEDGKRHVKLHLFAKSVKYNAIEQNLNEIHLRGFTTKEIISRITPLGRQIADLLLAVNRRYNKSDYIPCIVWGGNALYSEKINVGTEIKITGRIQSREYLKNGEVKVAYEVSISEIIVV